MSLEVIKGHILPECPPIAGIYEHVNTHIMYNKLISIDKMCVTFEGHLVTSKGHVEVKGQVQIHIGI